MKIKKIKWNNHPVLKNLELDFTDATTGNIFDTILFVGENGTGKTAILESINTLIEGINGFYCFDYIEYVINGLTYKAIPQTRIPNAPNFFNIEKPDGTVELSRDSSLDIRRIASGLYSKSSLNYQTKTIKSITTTTIDTNEDSVDISKQNDFTFLKQLIVDIENEDKINYISQLETNTSPITWGDFYLTSKMFRFVNAFNSFFDTLKYDKVEHTTEGKNILFKKHGVSINIDNLSTGEKQIVFRGCYLLRNIGILNNAVVMIDEPELSMHPKWEKRIFQYYKNLFPSTGSQSIQLFFASHSEYVLKDALSDLSKNLIIVLFESQTGITAKKISATGVLPSITSAETNYEVFDIVSNDYHIELYGYLQNKKSKYQVKSCDDFIKNHSLYIASVHERVSNHSTTSYSTLSTFIRNLIHHPDPVVQFTESELRTSIELLRELCR
jgi:ABC-type Mn2+/Zn2+ transport system ATPase subunit